MPFIIVVEKHVDQICHSVEIEIDLKFCNSKTQTVIELLHFMLKLLHKIILK